MHLALPTPAVARLNGLSAPLRGALWMCGAVAAFAVMINLVRHLTLTFDPLQVVFFRNAFGLIAMLPWLTRGGLGGLRTRRIGVHLARAAVGMVAMVLWFTTLSLMPLAEATALSFTAPMFTSVLAVLFLGEVMRARRWSAIGIAFLGGLVIIRPGAQAIEPVALLAVATSLTWAGGTILVKMMARTETAGAIVTWQTLLLTPLSLIPALFVWVAPDLGQLLWLGLLGVAGSIGHLCMARALASADATVVVPFDYLRLPLVALIAFLAFGETPDVWTWIGGGIIAASGIYLAHRESRVGSVTPPTAGSPAAQV
ncbi:MAG TPA: DMT family transporter [Geminicoccaceae bacterium]